MNLDPATISFSPLSPTLFRLRSFIPFPVFALLGAAFLLSTHAAQGQNIIASDSFELSDHPTGFRTTPTGSGHGMQFFSRNAVGSGNGYTPSIISDPTFGSLVLNSNDTTTALVGQELFGILPTTISLVNPNDYITLSFSFRFLNEGTASSNVGGFRFGLEYSNGTPVTGDGQGNISDFDKGYYTQIGVNSTPPGSGAVFFNEGGGIAPTLGGTDRMAINATTNGLSVNDNAVHTASFTISLVTATSVKLTMTIDGNTVQTNADSTTTVRPIFDEIIFGDGFVSSPVNYNLDNIQVTSNVPEPGSISLLLASSLALGMVRRRRR